MRMLDISGKFSGCVVVINDITRRKTSERERERLISELQEALVKVRKLSGMLPICAGDEIREKWFPNKVFRSLKEVQNVLADALVILENSAFRVASITGFHWIIRLIMLAT
jgi:hypothetical protein